MASQEPVVPSAEADMDAILERMEDAAKRLSEARRQGSVVRQPQTELDLLRQLEDARNLINAMLREDGRDREMLRRIFGDCTRISRVRAVLEAAEFSEMAAADQRTRSCLAACESMEQVLRDLGLSSALRKAQAVQRKLTRNLLEIQEDAPAQMPLPALEEEPGMEAAPSVAATPAPRVDGATDPEVLADAPVSEERGPRLGGAAGAVEFLDTEGAEGTEKQDEEPGQNDGYRLQVELLEATELEGPLQEPGPVDFIFGGSRPSSAALSVVYAEMSVGSQTVQTEKYAADGKHVDFKAYKKLFTYTDEATLLVRLLAGSDPEDASAGCPLLGEAELALSAELRRFLPPRTAELRLQRNGRPAGQLSVRYQMLQNERRHQRRQQKSTTFIGRAF